MSIKEAEKTQISLLWQLDFGGLHIKVLLKGCTIVATDVQWYLEVIGDLVINSLSPPSYRFHSVHAAVVAYFAKQNMFLIGI